MNLDRIRSQELRYVVVGAYNTAFGLLLYFLLFGLLERSAHYLVLLTANYVLGTLNGYIAYKLLVFRSGNSPFLEYLRFNMVHLAGAGVNYLALPALVEIVGFSPFVAQGMIVAALIVVSYVLHKHFTFKSSRVPDATR
jgi:putative flippase GtrA